MHRVCVSLRLNCTFYGEYFDHLLVTGQYGTWILTNYFYKENQQVVNLCLKMSKSASNFAQ